MELKVQCDCGQKYKFDVEPVEGRMPWEVNCPVCGASGTGKANHVIQQRLSAEPPVPVARVISTAEPALEAAPVASAGPPKPRLMVNRHPPAAPSVPASPMPRHVPARSAGTLEKPPASTTTLFFRGLLGAFIGAMIGMGAWYGLVVATGYQIGIVAWGVGALTGFGARVFGRNGSTALGVVSALFAAFAILGGGTLAVHHMVVDELGGFTGEDLTHEIYTESLKEAKDAGPLETDAQIKAFLAKRSESSEAEITSEEVASFKQEELEEIQQLASGALTEEQFKARYQAESAVAGGVVTVAVWLGSFIGNLFSIWTILWLLLGCASAYKVGADVG